MCVPLDPVSMMALSFGSTLLTESIGFMGESNAAASQNEYVMKQATADRNAKVQALHARLQQEQQASGQEIEKNTLKARKARSTATVSAGESGVSGNSVEALIGNFNMQEDRFNTAVRKNYEFKVGQAGREVKGFTAAANSRVAAAYKQPPSFLGAAARVAGAGFTAFTTFSDVDEDGNRVLTF